MMKIRTNSGVMAVLIISVLLLASFVFALPEGPTISGYSNSTKASVAGTASTVNKGSINFLTLASISQNLRWKAYVGNVTGQLVLQDADGYNIYDWQISGTISGTVIASRNSSINWNFLNCTNSTAMAEEHNSLSFAYNTVDNINTTFNATNHTAFTINSKVLNGCRTAYPYQNSTKQAGNSSANPYQEISIMDDSRRVGYATRIEASPYSYKNDTREAFQMILPDYGDTSISTIVTYYFFVELT